MPKKHKKPVYNYVFQSVSGPFVGFKSLTTLIQMAVMYGCEQLKKPASKREHFFVFAKSEADKHKIKPEIITED